MLMQVKFKVIKISYYNKLPCKIITVFKFSRTSLICNKIQTDYNEIFYSEKITPIIMLLMYKKVRKIEKKIAKQ